MVSDVRGERVTVTEPKESGAISIRSQGSRRMKSPEVLIRHILHVHISGNVPHQLLKLTNNSRGDVSVTIHLILSFLTRTDYLNKQPRKAGTLKKTRFVNINQYA